MHPPCRLRKPGPSCTHSSSVATKRATACAVQHSIRVISRRQASADTAHMDPYCCVRGFYNTVILCLCSQQRCKQKNKNPNAGRQERAFPCNCLVSGVWTNPNFCCDAAFFFYGISQIFYIFTYLRGYWGPALQNPITDLCPIVKFGNDQRGQNIDLAAANRHLHPHFRPNQDISCGHKLPGTEWLIRSTWQIPGGLLGFLGHEHRCSVTTLSWNASWVLSLGCRHLQSAAWLMAWIRFDCSRRHRLATLIDFGQWYLLEGTMDNRRAKGVLQRWKFKRKSLAKCARSEQLGIFY